MSSEDIQFPVYRKYTNGKNYFKILSPDEFEELQVIGKKVIYRRTSATLYPEKLFIKELIFSVEAFAIASSEMEFNAIKGAISQ